MEEKIIFRGTPVEIRMFGGSLHMRSARIFFILQKFFHILDQLGLNFDTIRFLQIVGNIVVYNL